MPPKSGRTRSRKPNAAEPLILRINGDELVVDPDRQRPVPFHCPSEALQTHLELLDWVDSPDGEEFTGEIVLRHRENTGIDQDGNVVAASDPILAAGYRDILWDTLNHNNTMYVSAHMCDQLQALIPTFEDEPLWPTDLPDEKGIVLFEAAIPSVMSDRLSDEARAAGDSVINYWIKGFVYRRIHGKTVTVARHGMEMTIHIEHAPSRAGVLEGQDDRRVEAFHQHEGLLVWPLFDAGEMFVVAGQWEDHGEPPVLPMPFCAVPFGPNVVADTGTDLFQMRQIAVTLFRLIWQHILVEEPLTRPERRRASRLAAKRHFPLDGEEIKLRHLRRLEGEGEQTPRDTPEGAGHTLTHRIIVRGHPRDQWYPSLGPARIEGQWNPASHRRIWIGAHIRGPEHAPLILKHSLDAVVR